MKRWSVLLLLLLLPLTMAPRTSFVTETFSVELNTARSDVRTGTEMAVSVKVTNVSADTTSLTPLFIPVTVDDQRDSVIVRAVSQGCTAAPSMVGCWIPELDPGESATLKFTIRPLTTGEIVFRFILSDGKELGSVSRRAI
jgi:hypothetical protein